MNTASTETAHYPSLRGRTAFVTGGSSGIGADIVRALVAQGVRTGFVGLNRAAAQKVQDDCAAIAQQSGGACLFTPCDVTDVAALQNAIAQTATAFGDIAILINNVANDQRHEFLKTDTAFFDWSVAVNMRPAFFAAQSVVAGMQRLQGGSIINIGSTGWKNKVKGYPAYATTKSAMNGLTRSLARELGAHNIRVNLLTPGWVMTDKQLSQWVDAAGEREIDENQCLPGRIYGADIAQLALFLAASDSRMVTAQEFVVDAGWS